MSIKEILAAKKVEAVITPTVERENSIPASDVAEMAGLTNPSDTIPSDINIAAAVNMDAASDTPGDPDEEDDASVLPEEAPDYPEDCYQSGHCKAIILHNGIRVLPDSYGVFVPASDEEREYLEHIDKKNAGWVRKLQAKKQKKGK